jgi:hypothetical protein
MMADSPRQHRSWSGMMTDVLCPTLLPRWGTRNHRCFSDIRKSDRCPMEFAMMGRGRGAQFVAGYSGDSRAVSVTGAVASGHRKMIVYHHKPA